MLFFLKDNKKEFILWLNVPKVTAYKQFVLALVEDEEDVADIDAAYYLKE